MLLSRRCFVECISATLPLVAHGAQAVQNWPLFRGAGGRGVADGFPVRSRWNADEAVGELSGVKWRSPVPGLGHSSPILWGDRVFLPTAIAESGRAPLKLGRGGKPTAAEDNGVQSWVILCYEKESGKEIWRRTARKGRPGATRHAKATHANTSLATDGRHLVAFFGSEGLYCYDFEGRRLWSQDLGTINISKYGIGWGYGSSPSIYQGRIALVCDDPSNPFLAILRLSDGQELWRVSRKGISERSWGTPLIHSTSTRTQVVVNGWPWIVAYDLEDGTELWRLEGGGDNPVPTPFVANDWIYITNAHGGASPIYVVRPNARGDISPAEDAPATEAIVWSTRRGGSYMSTPVVYGNLVYFGNTNGVIRCFDAKTGTRMYEERLDPDAAIYSSLVAADGKVFCASENGSVYVIQAGQMFRLLARNSMGEPCFATPAISQGVIYFRTAASLIAIG